MKAGQAPNQGVNIDVSIVVVSWNTCALLKDLLLRLQRITQEGVYPSTELIVVDNGSSDGSAEMVASRYPAVRLEENTENIGFAAACNLGAKMALGRTILFLNPDTQPAAGFISHMLSAIDRDEGVGAVGPKVVDMSGRVQESCRPEPTLLREFWSLFHLNWLYPLSSYPWLGRAASGTRQVDVLEGSCLLVRTEALSDAGGWNEDFFLYGEEVDLCKRLRAKDWTLVWQPRAEVTHFGGASASQAQSANFIRLYSGKIRYFREHRTRGYVLLYKLVLAVAAVSRLLLAPFAAITKPRAARSFFSLAGNYLRLLARLPGL